MPLKIILILIIINFVNCGNSNNNYHSHKRKLPLIIKHPKNFTISNETTSLVFDCELDKSNTTKARVSWFKDGLRLVPDEKKYHLLANNSLLVSLVNIEEDHGIYYCKAQNNYGSVVSNNATVGVTCKFD